MVGVESDDVGAMVRRAVTETREGAKGLQRRLWSVDWTKVRISLLGHSTMV